MKDGGGDGTGVSRGTIRIRKFKGEYRHYLGSNTQSGVIYHHTGCRGAGTPQGNKEPTYTGYRVSKSDYL